MDDQIRVLIVDDIAETRDHLTKLLSFERDLTVVGAAASGPEAIEMAQKLLPDVVLMDINMPEMDGITATERLASIVPTAAIVMMSVQGEADYLRRSMLAGAREFLVKPFSSDELTASIRQVYEREREKAGRMPVAPRQDARSSAARSDREPGRVVAVFSPKGGVGRTTVSVNVAVAAAAERLGDIVLMDAAFQFGDVAILLNLNPRSKSIADLIPEIQAGEVESLETFTVSHSSGLRVLLAPPSPETADLITPAAAKRVVEMFRQTADLVVIDCPAWFSDTTLAILDSADTILAVLTLEITSIKSIRLFLEVAEQLGYPQDRIVLALNRADSALGIRVSDVEQSIGRKIDYQIISDGRTVVYALNRGVPFVTSNREMQVSQDILKIARSLMGSSGGVPAQQAKAEKKRGIFSLR
jgi:pilus assembly protein CpaE